MTKSGIEWTELTWNPTTGCSKISAGCRHCYAEVMSRRLQAMGIEKYSEGFRVRVHEDQLRQPYAWKSGRMVFVNSMSDLFHEDIPLEFIQKVFSVMNDNPQHVFQVLTKRAERLYELHNEFRWSHNIWMGVTVENDDVKSRIGYLQRTGAKVKFLSCEPLIGAIRNMNLEAIDWVIAGGESGRNPRPMNPDWVLGIQEQCGNSGVAFFFKQWGGRNRKKNGRLLNGRTYDNMPGGLAHIEE
ncbi:MAG: phage Gp37/Gp68 family protein [Bacteroidales bacterium]|nr:phage Gp37/Gp68 family protein [Bacteroidales bacterium]